MEEDHQIDAIYGKQTKSYNGKDVRIVVDSHMEETEE